MGVEGIGRGARNADRVAEYPFGVDGGFGGGDSSTEARERWVGNNPGDEANQWDPHTLWRRLLGMGSGVEEISLGGVSVVWREDKDWQVKGMESFVPNVVSFLLTPGAQRS